jgi:hypothetical protein
MCTLVRINTITFFGIVARNTQPSDVFKERQQHMTMIGAWHGIGGGQQGFPSEE